MKITAALLLLALPIVACTTPSDDGMTPAVDAATSSIDTALSPADGADAVAPDTIATAPDTADVAPPPADVAPLPTDVAPPPPPVEDFACATDSDCCVVYGSCRDTLVLVTAKNRAGAEAAYAAMKPATPDPATCWPCVPPAVEVSCVAGRCRAERTPSASYGDAQALAAPHCGSRRAVDAGAPTTRALVTSDAAAGGDQPAPVAVFRCH